LCKKKEFKREEKRIFRFEILIYEEISNVEKKIIIIHRIR
jgi:hypothetical protein